MAGWTQHVHFLYQLHGTTNYHAAQGISLSRADSIYPISMNWRERRSENVLPCHKVQQKPFRKYRSSWNPLGNIGQTKRLEMLATVIKWLCGFWPMVHRSNYAQSPSVLFMPQPPLCLDLTEKCMPQHTTNLMKPGFWYAFISRSMCYQWLTNMTQSSNQPLPYILWWENGFKKEHI